MKYIKKSELYQKLNMLENAQDKFLILCIYNGLCGKAFKNLINMKIKDIDFEKQKIAINGGEIHMDSFFMKIAKEAVMQKEYIKKNCFSNQTNLSYMLNSNSVYILKSKPMKNNNNGLNPVTNNAINSRLATIKNVIDYTPKNLETSRTIDFLLSMKQQWKLEEIKMQLNKMNSNLYAYSIYQIINEKK